MCVKSLVVMETLSSLSHNECPEFAFCLAEIRLLLSSASPPNSITALQLKYTGHGKTSPQDQSQSTWCPSSCRPVSRSANVLLQILSNVLYYSWVAWVGKMYKWGNRWFGLQMATQGQSNCGKCLFESRESLSLWL